jgi:hypothetical protein
MSEPAAQHPWDRQPDEPSLWFARFDTYRLLGPSRTIEAAFREGMGEKGKCPSRWYTESVRWRWRERAEAWDASERPSVQRQRLAELAAERAINLAYHRLQRQKARVLEALEAPILEEQEAYLDGVKGEPSP